MSSIRKYCAVRWLIASATLCATTFLCRPASATEPTHSESVSVRTQALAAGERVPLGLGAVKAGETYRLHVAAADVPLPTGSRIRVELEGSGADRFTKDLHAGDPDVYLPYRPARDGAATIRLTRPPGRGPASLSLRVEWARLSARRPRPRRDRGRAQRLLAAGQPATSSAATSTARPMTSITSRTRTKGRSGLDWFRFEVTDEKPVLVYFQLDLLDRDVSANLRVYTVDPKTGRPEPYLSRQGPDGDRPRPRARAVLQAHQPDVRRAGRTISRSTPTTRTTSSGPASCPVPPYDDPAQAVEAGMHYIINVGDAWFAQIPREGNIYVRAEQPARHGDPVHGLPSVELLDRGQPGRPPQRLSDPLQVELPVRDRPARTTRSRRSTATTGCTGSGSSRSRSRRRGSRGASCSTSSDRSRGETTKTVERFGPFLARAWESRRDLPADELNGVIPLDSKFGFAWRDWRVLTRDRPGGPGASGLRPGRGRHRRDPRRAGGRPSDRDAPGPDPPALRLVADRQGEVRQQDQARDRGPARTPERRRRLARGRLADPAPARSTRPGQLTWTLAPDRPASRPSRDRQGPALPAVPAAGLRRLVPDDDARELPHADARDAIRRRWRWPRRFPGRRPRGRGWGNRDDGPARLPRTDIAGPHARRPGESLGRPRARIAPGFATAIDPLLDHPEPMVRAAAAACLGRLGQPGSVAPLVDRLDDPSKIVWRSAAWALRRLGNQGIGSRCDRRGAPEPRPARPAAGPRGSSPTSSQGMDDRLDLRRAV